MTDTKLCSACKQEKPLTDFSICHSRSNGKPRYYARCKPCYNASSRERYAKRKPTERKTYTRKTGTMGGLPVYATCTAAGCVFYATCKAQIWEPTFDPYCFAEGWRYELFVKEYAEIKENGFARQDA